MGRHIFLSIVLLVLCFSLRARADLQSEMVESAGKLQPILQNSAAQLAEGKVEEIDQQILATFPEKSRTPAQALILGNVLYKQDPRISYALHKQAAEKLPDEPMAQLEWAMEQHRAGEYAGAIESYEKFLKVQPQFAPALGMVAECYIRTGKIREAADAWMRSESGNGSIEELESWVCEVHTHAQPDQERAGYYTKAQADDIAAAEKLVALDCNFPVDWWNDGPRREYLSKDLEVLKAAKFKDSSRLAAVICAARCGELIVDEGGNAKELLRSGGFFFDDHATLPDNGKLLSTMLAAALSGNAITKEQARDQFGQRILDKAKATGDPDLFNAAANLYVGTDRLAEIDQLGWDATGQARFAASLLVGLMAHDKLKLDDPRLIKASAQFPENSEIAKIVVALTHQEGKPMEPVLVNAIKAEYSHFSASGMLNTRPRADSLRGYFAELSKVMKAKRQ